MLRSAHKQRTQLLKSPMWFGRWTLICQGIGSRKLVDTLPVSASRDGLEVASADLTLILLRSLPSECIGLT